MRLRLALGVALLFSPGLSVARAQQVIVSDGFSGAKDASIESRWPDTANLPGAIWQVDAFNISGGFNATLTPPDATPPSSAKLNCPGDACGIIAFPLGSQGAYVKPPQWTISADIGSPDAGVDPALGFYAELPAQNKNETVDKYFTGLRLICNGSGNPPAGTLTLIQNGVAANSIPFTGTFDSKVLHHLSYDVNTRTGAISNVHLQGSTSDYSAFHTTAFTEPATTFAAISVRSAGRDHTGAADNFQLTTPASVRANTTPPASPSSLTAVKGSQWNTINLKWDKSNARYSVYRGTSAGGEDAKPVATDLTTPNFTDGGLSEATTYYYKIKATNPNGTSESNEASLPVVNPLYLDRNSYPSYSLTWNPSIKLESVTAIFTHPTMPQRALVATQAGVLLTDDAGRTWNALPEAAAGKIGPIVSAAFHPLAADTFYLASSTKGIWATTNAGKTFQQIGSKAKGLASDAVTSLIVYSGDASHQTLLAVHGSSAAGLSRSRDAGQTWSVVNTDNHFTRIFGGAGNTTQFYLFGSSAKDPDIQSVYTCHTVGEYPAEVVRDVVPTDLFFAPIPARQSGVTYFSTSDSGLYRIDNSSVFGMAYDIKKLPYPGVDGWASIGMTWGSSADILRLYLYDPAKLGLVTIDQDLKKKTGLGDDLPTGVTANSGLPISSLTKEGAVLRPNANGTVCYAVANGSLSIGRTPEDVPEITCTPSSFEVNPQDEKAWRDLAEAFNSFTNDREPKRTAVEAAKALSQAQPDLTALYKACQLTVTARVPLQPAPPKSVTIDLSRYGGEPDTLMLDDGQHGDGVYATTFAFLPVRYRPRNEDPEWRCDGPGRIALGVVATYADGQTRGATGIVNYFEQILDLHIWGEGVGSATFDVENGVKAEPFLNPLAPKQPAYAPRLHKGDVAVRLTVPKGPWTVHVKTAYNRHVIDSYASLSFFVKLEDGAAPKEINLQLRDEPEFSPPTTTDKYSMLKDLILTKDYQRVSAPITAVLGAGSTLQTDHLSEMILSGDNDAPGTIVLDGLSATASYPPAPPPPEPAP